jgi:hypothetical protein
MVVAVVLAANVLSIGCAAGVVALLDRMDLMRPLLAAAVATTLATVLSLVPLVWGLRVSLNAAVVGYFLATGVRLAVSLGCGMLAVYVGKYPPTPTLLLMVALYVVLLAVEAGVVARVAWTAGVEKKT